MFRQQMLFNNLDNIDISYNHDTDGAKKLSVTMKWLNEAIDEIPLEQKTGYLSAQLRCPDIVLLESNPVFFLQYDRFHIWEAAVRLVKYWEWRVLLFEERAYMPILDINTHSNTEFLQIFNDGAMVILPGKDAEENIVVYFDKSRFTFVPFEQMDARQLLRVVFFTWTKLFNNYASRNDQSQRCEIIFLNLILTVPAVAHVRNDLKDIMIHAMPVELKRIHILFLPNFTGWARLIQNVMPIVAQMIASVFSKYTKNIIPHFSFLATDLADQLQSDFGLSKEILPTSIGGLWSVHNHSNNAWFKQPNQLLSNNEAVSYSNKYTTDGSAHALVSCPIGNTAAPSIFNGSSCTTNSSSTSKTTFDCFDSQERIQQDNQVINLASSMDPLVSNNMIFDLYAETDEGNDDNFSIGIFHDMDDVDDGLSVSSSVFDEAPSHSDNKIIYHDNGCDNGVVSTLCSPSVNSNLDQDAKDVQEYIPASLLSETDDNKTPTNNAISVPIQKSSSTRLRLLFDLHNKQDNKMAEQQLDSYWTKRTSLFGADATSISTDEYQDLVFKDKKDNEIAYTKFIALVRSKKKKGAYLMMLDPSKAVDQSFECQRRCFFFCLNQLLEDSLVSSEEVQLEVTILLFIDNNSNSDVIAKEEHNDTTEYPSQNFRDIITSFPIRLVRVHVVMEQLGLGWFAYEGYARTKAQQLIDVSEELIQIVTMDPLDNGISVILLDHGYSISHFPAMIGSRWIDTKKEPTWKSTFVNELEVSGVGFVDNGKFLNVPVASNTIAEEKLWNMIPLGQKLTTSSQQLTVADYWRRKMSSLGS